ncbi:MAG: glycosyltransferase [Eubacterium sp.]|nr:glycosyltransferase [Eubacterium sp.]
MKVSVVIPVYNVEKYVEESLRSVMCQTLTDIQIICIEDAGNDNSKEIIKRLMAEDSRISLFVNEQNRGLASVRNQGLSYAEGDYIYFLDSDDMIKADALKELYDLAEKDRLDAVVFAAESIFEDENLAIKFGKDPVLFKGDYPDVLSGKTLYKKWMEVWDWIPLQQRFFYNRKFLISNSIRFKDGQLHEDESFAFDVLMNAERVRAINEPYFIRRFRGASIMSGHVTMKNVESCMEIIEHAASYETEDEELKKAIGYYNEKLIRDSSNKFREALKSDNEGCKKAEVAFKDNKLFETIVRKSRREMYACSSYYQVMIAILKAICDDKMIDLVLEEHGIGTAEKLAAGITFNLPRYVYKVYICPDSEEVDPYEQKETASDKELSEKLVSYVENIIGNEETVSEYEKINVFWDLGYVGTYLNIRGISYVLHEDSLNSYKKIKDNRPNYSYIFDENERKNHKGVVPFGYSQNCEAVEVNEIQGIQIPTDKVTECSREAMITSLEPDQKKKIMNAFVEPEIMESISTDGETLLLLTEPFAVTGRLPHETAQERLYKDIVNEYGQGKKLVIKAHPRDAMDYEKIFPDAMIIEKNIPMEILNFNESISFSVAVTVTSSVIGGLANVGEKKLLGVDFLKKYAE